MRFFKWIAIYFITRKKLSDLEKAKRFAILALSYWNACESDGDIEIRIENTSTCIRMEK